MCDKCGGYEYEDKRVPVILADKDVREREMVFIYIYLYQHIYTNIQVKNLWKMSNNFGL